MAINWVSRLGFQIARSMRERPDDWYAGKYYTYNAILEIQIWTSTKFGPWSYSIKVGPEEIIGSCEPLPYFVLPSWRKALYRQIKILRKTRRFEGFVDIAGKRVYVC